MKILKKSKKQWHTQHGVSELPKPQRLLISRPDRLGDVVISSTCLPELRRQMPDTYIALAVNEPLTALFQGSHFVDEVIGIPGQKKSLLDRLRASRFDVSIQLNPDPAWDAQIAEAEIPRRLGFSRREGEHLTDWISYDYKRAGEKHEALFNFDLLEPYGVSASDNLTTAVEVSDKSVTEAASICGDHPYVLFHLASHGSKPRVPPEFFAHLAKSLLNQFDYNLVIVGAEAEDPGLIAFLDQLAAYKQRILNVAGKTDIELLSGICQSGQLMLSRDSGPAHLAAAVGCPTLTFFINSTPLMSPLRWRPIGENAKIYYKPVFAWPFEPPRSVARRIVRKYDRDEVYAMMTQMLNQSIKQQIGV
ncbi:glycosyltransferase family 9 protein [Rubellicoccus peritrichatus]|uniref:Glycosyltransferase family 9 protein n=1 Tax=Rubellicoccus peritrichatus TaxID=3080537 RepID=A0AAQ3QU87_9BACT|nr:glycosyltransferase family 9 protein [Puniceicoccus sp. CR14]WOO42151.1 glycosyltransferase family 9 protein [Puniceicoccus sp. CR14]